MSSPGSLDSLTRALNDAALSDDERCQHLLPLLYDDLHAAAIRAMSSERPDHTLDAASLVHEAFIRISGDRRTPWRSRAHFYCAAAEAMRRVLIDHARRRARNPVRRAMRLEAIGGLPDLARESFSELLRFDEAFRRLQGVAPDAADVLRLRLFAGLGVLQAAEVLGVSTSTVDRRWAFARAWLFRELAGDGRERVHPADASTVPQTRSGDGGSELDQLHPGHRPGSGDL